MSGNMLVERRITIPQRNDLEGRPYDMPSLGVFLRQFREFLAGIIQTDEYQNRVHVGYNFVLAADYVYNHRRGIPQNPDYIRKREIVSAEAILSDEMMVMGIPLRDGGLEFLAEDISSLEDISATTIGKPVKLHEFEKTDTLMQCYDIALKLFD